MPCYYDSIHVHLSFVFNYQTIQNFLSTLALLPIPLETLGDMVQALSLAKHINFLKVQTINFYADNNNGKGKFKVCPVSRLFIKCHEFDISMQYG